MERSRRVSKRRFAIARAMLTLFPRRRVRAFPTEIIYPERNAAQTSLTSCLQPADDDPLLKHPPQIQSPTATGLSRSQMMNSRPVSARSGHSITAHSANPNLRFCNLMATTGFNRLSGLRLFSHELYRFCQRIRQWRQLIRKEEKPDQSAD